MAHVNPGGHDLGPPNLDSLGIFYTTMSIIFTLFIWLSLIPIWIYRGIPSIKMRKPHLIIASVFLLQIYLIIITNVYTMNGNFPCGLEYWVMSLIFPVGLGFYQLLNMQLLFRSTEQRILLSEKIPLKPIGVGPPQLLPRLRHNWSKMNPYKRWRAGIAVGMAIQFIVSFAVFMGSRKFHTFGSFDLRTTPSQCRRGSEWVPSIIWQFLWSWVLGPYLLFTIPVYHDIYHWRQQTVISIVANLFGSPLWLAATYADSWTGIDKFWPPPLWFAPGLVTIQIVTIAGPLSLAMKHYRWEKLKHKANYWQYPSLGVSTTQVTGTQNSGTSSGGRKNHEQSNMQALERVLDSNPTHLLDYASKREFSGENIKFLVVVRNWKATWNRTLKSFGEIPPQTMQKLFKSAVDIYITYVDSRHSDFTVNLESRIYTDLRAVFFNTLTFLERRPSDTSASTPWEVQDPMESAAVSVTSSHKDGTSTENFNMTSLPKISPSESQDRIMPEPDTDNSALAGRLANSSDIPESFDVHVFDAAEASIRQMVLHGTWRNYNKAVDRESIASADG